MSRLEAALGLAPADLAQALCDRLRVDAGAWDVRAEVRRVFEESPDTVATTRALMKAAIAYAEFQALSLGRWVLREERARRPTHEFTLAAIETALAAHRADMARAATADDGLLEDREAIVLEALRTKGPHGVEELRYLLRCSPNDVTLLRRSLMDRRLAKPEKKKNGLKLTQLGREALRRHKKALEPR